MIVNRYEKINDSKYVVSHSPLHLMNHLIFQCEHEIRKFNSMNVEKGKCLFMSVEDDERENEYKVCVEYDNGTMTMMSEFGISLDPLMDEILTMPGRFLVPEATYEMLKTAVMHYAYEMMNTGSIEEQFTTHHMMSNAIH